MSARSELKIIHKLELEVHVASNLGLVVAN